MNRPSVLPDGMKLVGDVEGDGDLAVLGIIEGDVRIDGALVIETSGVLKGQVHATNVIVRGVLVGDGSAADTVRVEPGGRMVGDARAPRVSIIDGALFRGRVEMSGEASPRVVRSTARRRSTAGDLAAPSSAGLLTSPGTHATLPGFAPAAQSEPPPRITIPAPPPTAAPPSEHPPRESALAQPPTPHVRRGPPVPTLPALKRTEARRTEH